MAAGGLGVRGSLADEGPPETTAIRLKKQTAICFAPLYVVEAFLRAEGFNDVQYVTAAQGVLIVDMIEQGDLDFDITFAGAIVHELDSGLPLTALGGLHVGCYELFAREPIRTISDLKGRRVAVTNPNSGEHLYLSIMATDIGLDAKKDIDWVFSPGGRRHGAVHRRRGRRLSRLPAPAAGAARPRIRPRDSQYRPGPTLVAVLLLYDLR